MPTYQLVSDCPVCNHPDRDEIDAALAAIHAAHVGGPGAIVQCYGPDGTLTTSDVLEHDRHRAPGGKP